MEPVSSLTLFSDGLLSKWGFWDGDMPDHVWDYCAAEGLTSVDWHATLRRLVRNYLVPALDQSVEVVDIETIHNPVRASKVDGADVEDEWYLETTTRLTPECVTVTIEQVRAAIDEVAANSSTN